MRKVALDMVYELARDDSRVVFIGSDIGYKVLDNFKRDFPERFFVEGVSEAHVIGMAAGMAMEGSVVYVNTIASFLTRRCYEQVALDLCLHKLPVRLIGNGGGYVYAPLGPTHLAIEDISILRALPNMTILAPADAHEMRALMQLTLDYPGPIYVRLGKGGEPVVTEGHGPIAIGRALELRAGADVLIVTTGVMAQVGLQAAAELGGQGVQAGVLHCATVKPLDNEALRQKIAAARAVITIEEGVCSGGLGSAVGELMLDDRSLWRPMKRLGIPDAFPKQYGSQQNLLEAAGLTAERIAAEAGALLG